MRGPWWGLLALGLLSCYRPDLPSGKYACDTSDDCPAGLFCADVPGRGRRCLLPSEIGAADLARGPDLQADTAKVVEPCLQGGRELAPGVWGCDGNFRAGEAARQCRGPGYHVCGGQNEDVALLADLRACDELAGFYAARFEVRVHAQGQGWACEIGRAPFRGLMGCGEEPEIVNVQSPCGGLRQALRCADEPRGWRCDALAYDPFGGVARMSNNPVGGILCCRD